MSDRWRAVRRLAARERSSVRAERAGDSRSLLQQALRRRQLDIFPLPPGDPMLCGAKGVFHPGYIAYDRSLPAPRIQWVLAHELGHAVLHEGRCQCAELDIADDPVTGRLPYGAGAIDVYNPRQQWELEANVFAATFLLPSEELREHFLAGESFETIARVFGVSPTAALSALVDTFLWSISPSESEGDIRKQNSAPLDSSQRVAAEVDHGPILVDAGPGTGKTRTLVARAGHLLNAGISGDRIVMVTFSNRAAGEMRERLAVDAPTHAHTVTICTFHALCMEVLRRHHTLVELPADFAILDEIDAILLLERNLARLPLRHYLNVPNPGHPMKALVKAIGRAKDELVGPERYAELAIEAKAAATDNDELLQAEKWAEVAGVYAVYESLLQEQGVIDFGGLIMRAEKLLRDRADVLKSLQAQWPHILVDEFQDMNRASARLLQLLAGDGQGLWVVGDLRQLIYRFRGASSANITNFAQDFPGSRILTLGVNYRSDPRIVELVSAVGATMALDGYPTPTWQSFLPGRPTPQIWEALAEDYSAEVNGIASEIARRKKAGRAYRDQAILVLTHHQAQGIVNALDEAGIPALYLGDLFVRGEVRDLLALLSLVVEGDGASLLRVGAMAEHAMSREERIRLVRFAGEREDYFPGALDAAVEAGLSEDAVKAARELAEAIDAIGWPHTPWQFFARYLFGHGELIRRLVQNDDLGSSQKLMALGQLLAIARAFAERPFREDGESQRVLKAFLFHVRRLVSAQDNGVRLPPSGEDLDAVRVLTIHAAKGLEFPVVYVTNLAEGRFPNQRQPNPAPPPPGLMSDEDDESSESRALFFVAISRATQELVLTRSDRYGKKKRGPSPLLELAGPYLAVNPPQQLEWRARPVADLPNSGRPKPIERLLHIAEVEHYLRCPRRYEYRHACDFLEQDETLGYKRFQEVVHRVLATLREQHLAGQFGDEDQCMRMLADAWARRGPLNHPFEFLYLELAQKIVQRTYQGLSTRPLHNTWRHHIDIDLEGATVRIPIDSSMIDEDGAVQINRIHAREPKKDDHTAKSLALLRVAARNWISESSKLTIMLEYPSTGEFIEVAEKKYYEGQRIQKLTNAVAGIIAGQYPAQPNNGWDCDTCPYWMICPA